MSWEDRLQESLILVSPSGARFEALWQNNARSKEKKLGIFEYPGLNGTTVQDLGIKSFRMPITFYFEGRDHDIVSERFFTACDERGTWTITHPVKGQLTMQLVSVSEVMNPIEDGNLTTFKTDWINPLGEVRIVRPSDIAARVQSKSNELATLSIENFANSISIDNIEQVSALIDTAQTVTGIYQRTLSSLPFASNIVQNAGVTNFGISQAQSISRSILGLSNIAPLAASDVNELGTQISQMIRGAVSQPVDFSAGSIGLNSFVSEVSSIPIPNVENGVLINSSSQARSISKNVAAVKDLASISGGVALSELTISTPIGRNTTRVATDDVLQSLSFA